jgi:hypothetical protein
MVRANLYQRARCYIASDKPLDTPLAASSGNRCLSINAHGLPCFSSSEPYYTECVLIRALTSVLSYIQNNALQPLAVNACIDEDVPSSAEVEGGPEKSEAEVWGAVEEAKRPQVSMVNQGGLMREVKRRQRWRKFEQTGEALHSDFEDDSEDSTAPYMPLASDVNETAGDW